MTTQPPKVWSTQEIASAVGVDESNIRRALIDGRLAGFKVGRAWLVTDEEAKRFIAERQAKWNKF